MPTTVPTLLPRRVATSATPAKPARRSLPPLVRAIAFLLLIAGLAIGIHLTIHFGLRGLTTSTYGITNRIVSGDINADIVISGSSRAMVHYDPRVVSTATGLSTFNLGRNGSQTDLQLAVLKTYLAHNTPPRLVIHNLDLYSFATSHEIYDSAQYLPYFDEAPIYDAVRRVYPEAWKWKYLPLYGYLVPDTRFAWLLGVKGTFGFQPREDNIDGFVPRVWSWTSDFENFRRSHPSGARTAYEAQGVRDLEELLTLCQDRGIRVLLVYSPEYFEVQPLQLNRPQIFARFNELSRRFDAPLWDFSDSPISRSRDYFYNSQHLNATGAALFSQALAQRLSSPEAKAKLFAPRN